MATPLTKKFGLSDLRAARASDAKVPMLTCYDHWTARLMHDAGVPMVLVGDSAANVVLGYDTTLPVPLGLMIELTAAVRRGHPTALLSADMPFGSYQESTAQGVRNVVRMVRRSGCDVVKLEIAEGHLPLVQRLSDAGVAVLAHLGLRPQAVAMLGGYKAQGRTSEEAHKIVELSVQAEHAGAAAVLLEAVPPEVSESVVRSVEIPVIGCGAGPACHGHVVVTHDALGLTQGKAPRFVPRVAELAAPTREAIERYCMLVTSGEYPSAEHQYEMPAGERDRFLSTQTF